LVVFREASDLDKSSIGIVRQTQEHVHRSMSETDEMS